MQTPHVSRAVRRALAKGRQSFLFFMPKDVEMDICEAVSLTIWGCLWPVEKLCFGNRKQRFRLRLFPRLEVDGGEIQRDDQTFPGSCGKLEGGKPVSCTGANYELFYEQACAHERNYLHPLVVDTIVEAYELLEKKHPLRRWIVGDLGFPNGGEFPPHKTHRNGLSADFLFPVVDKHGELTGVISQTDLVYYSLTRGDELVFDSAFYHSARVEGRHVPSGFQFEDFNSASVSEVMTPVVHSVTEACSVESVARMMTREHIHRVIVRRGRKVAGIISALDVLRVHAKRPGRKRVARTAAVKPA